jgi:7,8-dihydropterin-6-yl-methyl-4-(beta-D-ribofuranosyl)aminobenzene 5'-phosphate synthase
MKITTLLENHPNKDQRELKAEHGLSFYIEMGDHIYMSDVGQSSKFADNAAKLGVNLAPVETLAISHHHYDHGGGLGRFFQENADATVYLRSSVDADFIAVVASVPVKYIGLDRGLLKQHTDRIVYIDKSQEVAPGFHLLTDIPNKYPKPSGDQRLKMRFEGKIKPDTFEHEVVTVLEGDEGLVVLTGCAHNGVLNMIAAVQKAFPGETIQAVIGGFHLKHENDETLRQIGEQLLALDIPTILTGHCTGDHATQVLEQVLGDRLQWLYTGKVMNF